MLFLFLISWGKFSFRFTLRLTPKRKKKKNPVNRRQGYQLSEQWIPIVSQVSRALEYPHGFCQGTQESWVIKS